MRKSTTVAAFVAFVALVACEPVPGPTPVPSSPTPRYAPCEYEDSPGPCSWDAERQGNGRGKSFDRHEDDSVTFWSVPVPA